MTDFRQFQDAMRGQRQQAIEAEQAVTEAQWRMVDAGRQVQQARLVGDEGQLTRAVERHARAVQEAGAAAGVRDDAWRRVNDRIGEVVQPDAGVIAGLDRALPIALLPVRLETRFHDADGGVQLKVRIFPDDIHIDDHEPALTEDEVTRGKTYWTAVRGGTPEAEAWTPLAAAVGPHRALWIREILEPAADLTFPDVQLRAPGTSRATVARALPDLFIVRVRVAGQVIVVPGLPLADAVQVGVDMSAATSTANLDGDVIVLAEGMRWMAEYDKAEAAGMAVTVRLPQGTSHVDDVTVIGFSVSLAPEDAGQLFTRVVASHRLTDGAGFVAPGTPTNNLSDTSSGYTARPDPARLDPASQPVARAGSNAAVLSTALGVPLDALAQLGGAADTDDADARAMQRATFEATWGPFLRQQAQPAFPVKLTPQVYQHVVDHVRGGGPLPVLRVGRQPYGLLPVQPAGWKANGDNSFVSWLGGYLPRVRQLWLMGFGDAPSGLAMYSHEAVSSSVRIRSAYASSSLPPGLIDLLGGDDDNAAQQRRLAAELNLGDALPYVLRNLYRKDPARLWLPMSVDDDLDFNFLDPKPKEAKSVLGLLLRNAALQVTSAAADEYRAGMNPPADRSLIGYQLALEPTFAITAVADTAVSTSALYGVEPLLTRADKLAGMVTDGAGQATISEKLAGIAANVELHPDIERYLFSDAVRAFLDAVADLRHIPTETRARLVGEALDTSSHRYDAWVTSLAAQRLGELRRSRPDGLQLGAWGYVHGVTRRRLSPVPDRPDLPDGVEQDADNKGFVLSPSMRQATVAGVLRAAWAAHGGSPTDAQAPFATDLQSRRVRRSLDLATGMRAGQQLGALLGYQLERDLHEASGDGLELDWLVFELRRRYPLRVATGENAGQASDRLVANGWQLAQAELDAPGSVVAAAAAGRPAGERQALQAVIDDVIRSLDGLTDLGLAESVYQLAGRNFERASAAADMVGRAAVPPDGFDVASTARGGRGIEQRLVFSFGAGNRPAGWVATTPRARLAPEADAFVAERLGSINGVTVRLLDPEGAEVAHGRLADFGLAALDLAADAASTGGTLPFPLLLARAAATTGAAGQLTVGMDPEEDAALIALLAQAAAWHRALAARPPLTPDSFVPRGQLTTRAPLTDALAAVAAVAAGLSTASANELQLWGVFLPAEQAKGQADQRLKDVGEASDPVLAARALFGGDAVVTGTSPTPSMLTSALSDQTALGVAGTGAVEGWLADTARVRTAARAMDDALLLDELADRPSVALAASQSPVTPYAAGVDAGLAKRWLGLPFPGPLGPQPGVSVVVAGDATGADLVGVELDAWVEVVPDRAGAGAVAANFSAPDARAPNTILLAVPADVSKDWTQDAMFSVVDEALSLAQCRMVDLDASKRVPQLLPACFIADYEEPTSWWQVLTSIEPNVTRYRGML